jgi:hypothetical protein
VIEDSGKTLKDFLCLQRTQLRIDNISQTLVGRIARTIRPRKRNHSYSSIQTNVGRTLLSAAFDFDLNCRSQSGQ